MEKEIPAFLKALGNAVKGSGLDFDTWYESHADEFRKIAEAYL